MAKNFSSFPGGVPVTGGIEPAGNFPVVESKFVQVSEDGKTLADVLGSGTGSIESQIASALTPYSTTSQVKAFNDMANYYTKTQLDGTTGKVDKGNITTGAPASGNTDAQVPSTKSMYTALGTKVNTSDIVKTITSSATDAQVPSAKAVNAAISSLNQAVNNDFYTKEEADDLFYVAISFTKDASNNDFTLSTTTLEQGTTSNNVTVTVTTNTVPKSVKVNNTEMASSYTGVKNTKAIAVDVASVGSKNIAVVVTDRTGATASSSRSVTVGNRIYAGGAAAKAASSTAAGMIGELGSGAVRGSKAYSVGSVSVAANKRLTIAIPTVFGNASFSINNQNTILDKVLSNVDFTTPTGQTVKYDIYQNNVTVTTATTYTVIIS